jgi:hypothetical protein
MVSLDLPVRTAIETVATLYQRDQGRFHVLLDVPIHQSLPSNPNRSVSIDLDPSQKSLLWLEISPTRAIFTVQSKTGLSYRHMWERGTYGISRYWLNDQDPQQYDRMRLRNFTRSFELFGQEFPSRLRLEYELWSHHLQLGIYVLELEVHH